MAQQSQFRINGIIDTTKNCLSNLEAICRSAGCFSTYDTTTGLWSVILNTTGYSKYSFNNSNIIGGITVSGTGIDQLYNSAEVQYPLTDISGGRDNQNIQIDNANWFSNELPKRMNIQLDLINNPVQAQFIGAIELKQNRLDKIITFTTDYSGLTLRAGNLIDVTNTNYGYTNKMFRIISMVETDDDTGIKIQITALEYDATVYDATGLTYTNTVTANGVVPAYNNAALQGQNANALRGLITIDSFSSGIITATNPNGQLQQISLGHSVKLPYTGKYHTSYSINWGGDGSPSITIGGTVYPWGVLKNSALIVKKGNTVINDIGLAYTGDRNVPLYEDHFLDAFYSGTAGDEISFYFGYATNWGGDYGGNGGAGTNAIFLITSETTFNGV